MVRTIILKLEDNIFDEVEKMKKEATSPSWESFFMNCYNCYKGIMKGGN